MKVKYIQDETFQDYKKISMLIATCFCDFKCCVEQEIPVEICQNSELAQKPIIDIPDCDIIGRYLRNPLTKAIVIGGLEPFMQAESVYYFINAFRANCSDDIVIYTGYTEDELKTWIDALKQFENIIIKFGRFQYNGTPKFDEVLGVKLASDNQYAKIIS